MTDEYNVWRYVGFSERGIEIAINHIDEGNYIEAISTLEGILERCDALLKTYDN